MCMSHASLDPPVSAPTADREAAEQLSRRVEEAAGVLGDYNASLERELRERREIQQLLDAFIWQQKALLKDAKRKLRVRHACVSSLSVYYNMLRH